MVTPDPGRDGDGAQCEPKPVVDPTRTIERAT